MNVGDDLLNGAICLDCKNGIVIAMRQHHQPHPFATWRIADDGSTYQGNYFCFIDEAIADFKKRARIEMRDVE